jgi:hypothetical protein
MGRCLGQWIEQWLVLNNGSAFSINNSAIMCSCSWHVSSCTPGKARRRGIFLSGSHPLAMNCNPDRRREATQGRLANSQPAVGLISSSTHFTLTLTRLPHSFGSAETSTFSPNTTVYHDTKQPVSASSESITRAYIIHPPQHVVGDHLWANSTADVAPPSCMLPAASTWPRQRTRPTTATDSLRYPWAAPTPATLRPPLSTRTRTRGPRAQTWR